MKLGGKIAVGTLSSIGGIAVVGITGLCIYGGATSTGSSSSSYSSISSSSHGLTIDESQIQTYKEQLKDIQTDLAVAAENHKNEVFSPLTIEMRTKTLNDAARKCRDQARRLSSYDNGEDLMKDFKDLEADCKRQVKELEEGGDIMKHLKDMDNEITKVADTVKSLKDENYRSSLLRQICDVSLAAFVLHTVPNDLKNYTNFFENHIFNKNLMKEVLKSQWRAVMGLAIVIDEMRKTIPPNTPHWEKALMLFISTGTCQYSVYNEALHEFLFGSAASPPEISTSDSTVLLADAQAAVKKTENGPYYAEALMLMRSYGLEMVTFYSPNGSK